MIKIAPSILSADFNHLLNEVKSVSKAKILHIDIMDGHFVPNISFGPVVVKSLKSATNQFLDVHLMISNPLKYLEAFKLIGSDQITFHVEATKNPQTVIEKIKTLKMKAGISLRPKTPLSIILPFLHIVDNVLVMSVEPGFSGQKYIFEIEEKLKALKRLKVEKNLNFTITVDGGINDLTYKRASAAGAEILVVGSFLFKQENRNQLIERWERDDN